MEIDIAKNVLIDIACTALDRIEGLEVATSNMKVGEVLKSSPRRQKAIKVSRDGDGVTYEVGVNVEYGRNLVNLARDVQQSVTENVELMTGLKVRAVNVTVQNLTLPRGA